MPARDEILVDIRELLDGRLLRQRPVVGATDTQSVLGSGHREAGCQDLRVRCGASFPLLSVRPAGSALQRVGPLNLVGRSKAA